MATLEQFKQLETNPEKLSELASQYIVDPEAAKAKLIQMAADKGFELTSEEMIQFISQMNEDDEFSDLELSPEALSAVAGGFAVDRIRPPLYKAYGSSSTPSGYHREAPGMF